MTQSVRPPLPLTAAEREVIRLRAELKAAQPQQQAAAARVSTLGVIDATQDMAALDLQARKYQAQHPGTDYLTAVKAVQTLNS